MAKDFFVPRQGGGQRGQRHLAFADILKEDSRIPRGIGAQEDADPEFRVTDSCPGGEFKRGD